LLIGDKHPVLFFLLPFLSYPKQALDPPFLFPSLSSSLTLKQP
jgi:hypothetical protein